MPLLRRSGDVIVGQLALDFDAAARMEDDLILRVRQSVVEPGMTDDEIHAAVVDALGRLGISRPPEAAPARPCICERPLLFAAELGAGSCGLCGREPARTTTKGRGRP